MASGELACTYAALILHDEGVGVTADKLKTLVKAAGVEIAPYWPSLFEKLLAHKNIDDLLLNAGGSGAPAAAPAAAAGGAAPAAEKGGT
jgi:large subunit ribosomal protein LP1